MVFNDMGQREWIVVDILFAKRWPVCVLMQKDRNGKPGASARAQNIF
jgi:hypothetical protein